MPRRQSGGLCPLSNDVFILFLRILSRGGNPWRIEERAVEVCCVDSANPVIFLMERIEGEPGAQ